MRNRSKWQAVPPAETPSRIPGNLAASAPAAVRCGDVSRRTILLSLGGAVLLVACGRRDARAPAVIAKSSESAEAADFLRLSQALTGHTDLDATTALRIVQAFTQVASDVQAHFNAMGALVRPGDSPSEVLAAATAQGMRSAALSIVAAWYTGTVGTGTRALTVSYRDALMQRPVSDALTPPTYVRGGPAWWTALPPEAVVIAHAARASANAGPARNPR